MTTYGHGVLRQRRAVHLNWYTAVLATALLATGVLLIVAAVSQAPRVSDDREPTTIIRPADRGLVEGTDSYAVHFSVPRSVSSFTRPVATRGGFMEYAGVDVGPAYRAVAVTHAAGRGLPEGVDGYNTAGPAAKAPPQLPEGPDAP